MMKENLNEDQTVIHLPRFETCQEILEAEKQIRELMNQSHGKIIFRLHGSDGQCAEVRVISDLRHPGSDQTLPYFF